MVRINSKAIVCIMVFCLCSFLSPQDKQDAEDKDQKLREEILSVYQNKGKEGLRDFVKQQKEKITNTFVRAFVILGVDERKEEWLRVCEVITEVNRDEKFLAFVFDMTGTYYMHISDLKKASDYFDKALSVYKKMKSPNDQGIVYQKKGDIYSRKGDPSKALENYSKAMQYFDTQGNYTGKGNIYKIKGDFAGFKNGNYSEAIEMYDKALLNYEKSNELIGQGNIYWCKGKVYYSIGEYSKAFEMYDNAVIFFERAKNRLGVANIYIDQSEIYLIRRDYKKALDFCDKAFPLYKKLNDPLGVANVHLIKGDIYMNTGYITKAFEMYERALAFFEKDENFLNQGHTYLGKGNIYLITGENAMALAMYSKALSLYKKAEYLLGQSIAYICKGNTYSRIGYNQKALELYDNALDFLKKAGSPIGQGNAFYGKGLIYTNSGNYSKALDMLNVAQTLYKKIDDSLGQGNVYLAMAEILPKNTSEENKKEYILLNNALKFYEKIKEPHGQGEVFRNFGDICLLKGNHNTSLALYEKALSFYKMADDIESEAYALIGKAQVLSKQGKNILSLNMFISAISKLEKVRTQTAFSEMKKKFMEKVFLQYLKVVLFMIEKKFYVNSFKYAESMKARVFLDQMAEGLERPDKGLNPELKEKKDNLVGKLSALSRQMQETPGNEEKKLQELKKQYRQVESEFEDLLIKIRLDNPLYASINYPQPISVNDLQTNILKKGESLLSFFISPEKTFIFIVSKEKFRVKQLKVTESEINGLVNRHLQAINENNSRDIMKYGSLLHEKLFKPLEKYLKKSRDIIIVPSGELETIPFESLVSDKNKSGHPVFLLEKYRVKYLQSATLLSILRKHYKRDNGTQSFIGFGDPVYETTAAAAKEGSHKETQSNTKGKKTSSVPSVSSVAIKSSPGENETPDMDTEHEILEIHRDRFARAGGSLPRLPNSGEEINTIARLFTQKGQKTRVFLRDQASEANAKTPELKDFDYIHFSCHGLLNDDFQCLVLSRDAGGKEDGYLTLNEIMNCDFNAKLVVLSACMTGSGKKYKGEGVTGLTRAVMYAGSPAVIASLWKVDDFATKELMVNFYKNLLDKNLDKSEALRLAKLELLNTEKYRSPFFWSAFVMYGE